MPLPPPLPDRWPFRPRTPIPLPLARPGLVVPGQRGAWEVVAIEPLPEAAPEGMGGAYGRGGVARLGDWVVRPYRRGGLVRHLNKSVYLGAERFVREFEVHAALWAAGFPTVEPLGFARRRHGLGWQGLYFTRHAEATPWPRNWEAGARRLAEIVALLQALCDWGVWAPDLNATNLLMDAGGAPLALDWDRARWEPGASDLGRRYAHRLLRSLRRLRAPAPVVQAFEAQVPPAWGGP